MIHVDKIKIQDFRGIRNLTIDFAQKNFAVCGRNGTGKSGVVDAIEFGLTGNISRLSGTGTGGISLIEHAPHVDSRDNPENAKVTVELTIVKTGRKVTITRDVKEPLSPIISSKDPSILRVLHHIAAHPEFTLSRRELIKYVISAPGDRAKEVQSLLRLDEVENFRVVSQKVANSAKKEVAVLKSQKDIAQEQLTAALEITELNNSKLLEAVNKRRGILGLGKISVLTRTTSLRDGLGASTDNSKHIPKNQVIADLKQLQELVDLYGSKENLSLIDGVKNDLKEISKNKSISSDMTKEKFLKMSLDLIEDEMCPLCDTPWEMDKLKNKIEQKVNEFEKLSKKKLAIEQKIEPYANCLEGLISSIQTFVQYADLLSGVIEFKALTDFKDTLTLRLSSLRKFIPLSETISAIEEHSVAPRSVTVVLTAIKKYVTALPDTAIKDSARDFLTICQERLERYRDISLRHKKAEEESLLADNVFKIYAKISTEVLNDIYKKVEKDFTDLYSFINSEDEKDFSAELKPSIGKLSFEVNFYGRGYFPPGAYHSEGHQDAMGLCLYLALMKHLSADDFTFAVLDDVVMSVDAGHRRKVCELLKEKFPHTQFILTTHDNVWLKHMKTAGLIGSKSSKFFKNWCVENGPSEWDDRDVWTEIDEEIKENNIREAASLLRYYLEFVSFETCHLLRAQVEFHGDGQFDLGDLLPQASARFSKLLQKAESATRSWGKTKEAELIKKRKAEFDSCVAKSQLEQWQTNSAIHFNEWANLQVEDFKPLVQAFRQLVESFHCPESKCNSIFYVTPTKGLIENLKCSCGALNLNLVIKSNQK